MTRISGMTFSRLAGLPAPTSWNALPLIRQRGNRCPRCEPSPEITSRSGFRFTTILTVTGPDPVIPVATAARDGLS
jgi:hypothetical protein